MRFLAAAVCALAAMAARAGLGPENVAVVVNGDSAASILIADEYLKLRDIPRSNLIVLHQIGDVETTDVESFRQKILKPVLDTLRKRGLTSQIDCIAYSADLPTIIDVSGDVKGVRLPQVLTTKASINGLTYLCDWTLRGDIEYLMPDVNRYARAGAQAGTGFRRSRGWNIAGGVGSQGPHYMLSTVLGVTAGRGNSVQEALDCLRRSKEADFTRPKGTIYFEENGDVRTRTRQWAFDDAAKQLERLGVKAVVEPGTLPIGAPDVAGAMIGTEGFNWPKSGSKILPGAICENLTSFGGDLMKSSFQTPCSEFIRNGASGTSGTVTEPYAVQPKFPTAFMQVQYASGFTLAESFYLSVSEPYQLLILGDPLCRPWSRKRNLTLSGIKQGAVVAGKTTLRAKMPGAASFELYVDGRLAARSGPDGRLAWNSAKSKPGAHKLSILARCNDTAESVVRAVLEVKVRG